MLSFSMSKRELGLSAMVLANIVLYLVTTDHLVCAETYHQLIKGANQTNFNLSVRTARRSVVSGGLFSIVSFDNVACTGTSGLVGTCYSRKECAAMGGVEDGPCAGNFGVVCRFSVTCGGTVKYNNTYFRNPSYPSTDSGVLACAITINKFGTATEYIVDYGTSVFASSANGLCSTDSVRSTNAAFDTACGNLTGSSSYLPWGNSTVNTLTVNIGSGSSRNWQFLISQAKSGDCCYAPLGCDQYFNSLSGTVTSPGFDGVSAYIETGSCVRQCFLVPAGYCTVTLTPGTFNLQGTTGSCTTDYLQPNGTTTTFCGQITTPITVTKTTSNYTYVNFCTGTAANTGQLGYSLAYNVNACYG